MRTLLQSVENGESVWRLQTTRWQHRGWPTSAREWSHAKCAPLENGTGNRIADSWNKAAGSSDRDQEFIDLLAAYRSSGGLARTNEVVGSFMRGNATDTEQLARWMVTRQIISIDWHDQTWFPWFQLDRESGQPRPLVGEIVRELSSELDHWEIASWFAQPNPWLNAFSPAESLASRSADVLAAAQVCRFLVKL